MNFLQTAASVLMISIASAALVALIGLFHIRTFTRTTTPQISNSTTTEVIVEQNPVSDSPKTAPPSVLSTPGTIIPYECYGKVNNSIVLQEYTGALVKLVGADPQSFVDLSQFDNCFGKDKNHVYYYNQILPWADPTTFSMLWYTRSSRIFFSNGMQIVASLMEPDTSLISLASTTVTGPEDGAYGFYVVPGGDSNTFQTLIGAFDIAPWAKDKNNVYCKGSIIQYADPSTAALVDNNEYLRVLVDGTPHIYDSACIIFVAASGPR